MANIYSPIGRKGYYSFETVEQQGTRYVWNANLNRWDIYGGSDYELKTGNRVPTFVPPTLPPVPGVSPVPTAPLPLPPKPPVVIPTAPPKPTPPKVDPPPPQNLVDINKFQFKSYNFVVKAKRDDGKSIFAQLSDGTRIPKALKFSKDDILAGDKTLTATADGYTCNEEYVISNEVIAGNPGPSGVNRAVVVKKFVNGQLVTSDNQVGQLFTIEFSFKKVATKTPTPVVPTGGTPVPTPPKDETRTLRWVVSGEPDGILLLQNNKDEIVLSKSLNKIDAPLNTKFTFRVKPGYKVYTFGLGGKPIPFDEGTNPNVLVTLDRDINGSTTIFKTKIKPPTPVPTPVPIPILVPTPPPPQPIPLPPKVTEEEREEKRLISQPIIPDGPEPLITLLENKTRTYDIKDKSGLPIAFRKNEEVKAVTVFVGTKHYVFDGLAPGPVGGVVVPASAFQQLGRLEVKIIPYDLDELDDNIELITRSQITRTKEIVEERIVEVRRPVPTPIEIEERYEETPPPVIPDPIPYPLPPKPKPKDPIRVVPTKPPKVEQPKPRVVPTPQPVRVVPTPPRVVPTPSRGGGGGGPVGGEDVIDRRTNIPRPGYGDIIEDDRIRRTERLL